MKKLFVLLLAFLLTSCSSPKVLNVASDDNLCMPIFYGKSQTAYIESQYYYSYEENLDTNISNKRYYNIYVVDISTGHKSYLCNRAECTHNSEECTSYYNFRPEYIMYNNNYLIIGGYFEENRNETGLQLYVSDINGENRKKIFNSSSGETIIGSFILGNDSLYFDEYITNDENTEKVIKKISLNSNEEKIIYHLKDNEQSVGAYSNKIFIEEYQSGLFNNQSEVYSISTNGDIIDESFSKWTFGEKKGHFVGRYYVEFKFNPCSITVFDLSTNKTTEYATELHFSSGAYNLQYIDDNIICFTARTNKEKRSLTPYVYNRVNDSISEAFWYCTEIPDFAIDVISSFENNYLVISDYYKKELVHPSIRPNISNAASIESILMPQYSLISKENYSNQVKNLHKVIDIDI